MLMFLIIMTNLILLVPGIVAQKAGRSAWIASTIFPMLAGYLALWIVWKLGQRFSGLTLIQYGELVFGKVVGKCLGLIYVLFLFMLDVLAIREYSCFYSLSLMPATPSFGINLILVLVGGYMALKGIEVVSRMTQLVLPLFVLSLLALAVVGLTDLDLGYLKPLFESGLVPIIKGSATPASVYGEINIMALLFPMVTNMQGVKRKGMLVLIVVAVFFTIDTVAALTIIGPELTASRMFPFWDLSRYGPALSLLERIDSYISVIWIMAITIKVAIFTYLISWSVTEILGIKTNKPIIYGLLPLQIILATYPDINFVALRNILAEYCPPISLFFELVFPLFVLIVAVIRKKH